MVAVKTEKEEEGVCDSALNEGEPEVMEDHCLEPRRLC